MQILLNWLSGTQNFSVGAMLYQSFGTNQALKDLLEMGETPFAAELLAEELKKLAENGVKETPMVTDHADLDAAEMPESENEILQALKNEWQPFYQEMNLLRHELDRYGDDNSDAAIAWRKPRARKIKELEQQCIGIWKNRDYYEKHGKLPFTAEKHSLEIPTDAIQLAGLIGNIKKYIRRYRKLMQDKPGEPKYVQLYNDYKQQHKTVTGVEYVEKN